MFFRAATDFVAAFLYYGFRKAEIMKIWNCSLEYVKNHLAEIVGGNEIRLISINNSVDMSFVSNRDNTEQKVEDAKSIEKILFLFFDDITPNDISNNTESKKLILFDESHAPAILDFATKALKDGKKLWVHCTAGRCRSSAVSLALNDFLNKSLSENLEDWQYNRTNGFEYPPLPNPYVSMLMNRAISKYLKAKNENE